ncbi:MAG: 30S ribosomal protein S8 [Myxococcales bacterium]|jgi:small subunit ribosomal protein S8|nr:30S ribosomal protein S8 [Myxococcales bacterium]
MMTDPIADLLTRIRNAGDARHAGLRIPASKVKEQIASILKNEGFIESYELVPEGPQGTLNILLKYGHDKQCVIRGVRRLSKPGCRQYVKTKDIPKVLGGLGIAIVSTSQGMMTDRAARKARVGGELICAVW